MIGKFLQSRAVLGEMGMTVSGSKQYIPRAYEESQRERIHWLVTQATFHGGDPYLSNHMP